MYNIWKDLSFWCLLFGRRRFLQANPDQFILQRIFFFFIFHLLPGMLFSPICMWLASLFSFKSPLKYHLGKIASCLFQWRILALVYFFLSSYHSFDIPCIYLLFASYLPLPCKLYESGDFTGFVHSLFPGPIVAAGT